MNSTRIIYFRDGGDKDFEMHFKYKERIYLYFTYFFSLGTMIRARDEIYFLCSRKLLDSLYFIYFMKKCIQ